VSIRKLGLRADKSRCWRKTKAGIRQVHSGIYPRNFAARVVGASERNAKRDPLRSVGSFGQAFKIQATAFTHPNSSIGLHPFRGFYNYLACELKPGNIHGPD